MCFRCGVGSSCACNRSDASCGRSSNGCALSLLPGAHREVSVALSIVMDRVATKRRDGKECISKQELEQETTKGPHNKRQAHQCHGSVYRGCANLMARAAGRQVSPGAEFHYED